ncbi:MAG TPA: carboxypeptidase-like regulatory domain-containing protein [Cyclobacteriaceae bacterium]|nr:carboxypeptidase-like regulatory domain-containing protein [Cyclobacteriaceae bacterium]
MKLFVFTFSVVIFINQATNCNGQVQVTGTVISADDKLPIPGVNVVEKGTQNGTVTQADGKFSIEVQSASSVLQFSFIGFVTTAVEVKDIKNLVVKLKLDCNKDFFDSQQIFLYANSGLIHNPIGGQMDVASPWIFGGVIKGAYSYQTDLDVNRFENAQLEFSHYISNCDFDIDFGGTFRRVSFNDLLNSQSCSLESDLNIRSIKLTAGYSHLRFDSETTDGKSLHGVSLGIGKYFNMLFYPTLLAKVQLYNNAVEYQASLHASITRRVLCFIKFYKFKSFEELSIGVGLRVGYRLANQRKPMLRSPRPIPDG